MEFMDVGMCFAMGLTMLMLLSFLMLMLFMHVVDGLVNIDLVQIMFVQMLLLEMQVMKVNLVKMMLMDHMLMVVMLVNHFLCLVVLVDDLLGAVLVVLEVLDGVSWFLDISVVVILLDRGGTLGVRVLSVNDLHGLMSMSISTSMSDLRNSVATGFCCVSSVSVGLVPTFHWRFGGDKAQKGAKD